MEEEINFKINLKMADGPTRLQLILYVVLEHGLTKNLI